MSLYTRGLPGSLEPYRASIDVDVVSQLNTTLSLEVSLFVTSADGRPCPENTWFVEDGCRECPPQFHCGIDATVATAALLPGFWRAGPNATTAYACASQGNRTSCKGGTTAGELGESYCVDTTYTGARCEACVLPDYHFDTTLASCVKCPDRGGRVAIVVGTMLALAITIATCLRVIRQPPRRLEQSAASLRTVGGKMLARGLLPSLKITFSFTQIVSAAPSLLGVSLPSEYQAFWNGIARFQLNLESFAPVACFGDFEARLLITSLTPLVLMATVLVCCVLASLNRPDSRARWWSSRRQRFQDAINRGFLQALPWLLLISFLLVPTVSETIFSAFDCISYDFDGAQQTDKYFLRTDPSVGEDSTFLEH